MIGYLSAVPETLDVHSSGDASESPSDGSAGGLHRQHSRFWTGISSIKLAYDFRHSPIADPQLGPYPYWHIDKQVIQIGVPIMFLVSGSGLRSVLEAQDRRVVYRCGTRGRHRVLDWSRFHVPVHGDGRRNGLAAKMRPAVKRRLVTLAAALPRFALRRYTRHPCRHVHLCGGQVNHCSVMSPGRPRMRICTYKECAEWCAAHGYPTRHIEGYVVVPIRTYRAGFSVRDVLDS